MAKTTAIEIYSGLRSALPVNIPAPELLLTTDTHELFHGNPSGNPYPITQRRVNLISGLDNLDYCGLTLSDINAGESLIAPNLVYLKSTGKWFKANATSISTCPCIGIILNTETVTANNPVNVLILGTVRNDSFSFSTVGGLCYPSTTGGLITQTAPSGTDNVIQPIGIALTSGVLYFNPSLAMVEHT